MQLLEVCLLKSYDEEDYDFEDDLIDPILVNANYLTQFEQNHGYEIVADQRQLFPSTSKAWLMLSVSYKASLIFKFVCRGLRASLCN